MTAVEVFELTSKGGATDFERVIEICRACGPYCLIGGLAVNCFVDPVYTLDADFVIAAAELGAAETQLRRNGFEIEDKKYTLNAQPASSQLRVQFTKDPRYQSFALRAINAEVLQIQTRVACLDDLVQGKLWAYGDPERRLSKRQKDRLDLIRLAEAFPYLLSRYPDELQALIAAN